MTPAQVLNVFRQTGAKIACAASLIERSGGKASIGTKLIALAQVDFPSWDPEKLPPHLKNTPAIKPGSRGLA